MDPSMIAAIVSTMGALISGVFAFVVSRSNNRNLIKQDERNRREAQYFGLIGELVKFKESNSNQPEISAFAQQGYLVGDPMVVRALDDYLTRVKAGASADVQNTLYSRLLQAMRADLYGDKVNSGFPPKVELTVFR